MAAPTIRQILERLEQRLESIDGLRVTAYVADQVNPPQAVIGVPPIPSYHRTMGRGLIQLNPTVTVLVSAALDRAGQLMLADYANPTGTKSIVQAIESDKTLGGIVDDCMVVDFTPLGLEQAGLVGYYGGVFTLQVHAQGA